MSSRRNEEPVIVKTASLATMLCLSERRIQQLREAGMPRVAHGKWNLIAVLPWFLEHQETLRGAHHNPSLEAARKRKLAVDTELAEHKLAQEKGQSISLAEHKAVVSELCADIAQTIEAFPVRKYNDPKERAYASRFVFDLRTELAKSVAPARMEGSAGDGEPVAGAASDAERESVGSGTSDAATA